ncbi:MAG: Gfo/Idh/MocA family oxidoreductase [Ginsengibacter sp.]
MSEIRWGIIGCGGVTEVKSGPAFNKVPDSSLLAVMRRDAAKAEDYARRHDVPHWYNDADQIINNPKINAVYVATPPSSHEDYVIKIIDSGKHVYVEKPMALDYASAKRMADYAAKKNVKLCVAHYRRQQPVLLKIKEMLASGVIGQPLTAELKYYRKPLSPEELARPGVAWRVDYTISGGGLFHDLAPHQLDLAYYFFGDVVSAEGLSFNQGNLYPADDIVNGNIRFKNGVLFNGTWSFNSAAMHETDLFEILGSKGKLSFAVFGDPVITLENEEGTNLHRFEKPEHVQQYLIKAIVQYYLGKAENPCSGADGAEVMRLIDAFTKSLKRTG